MDQTGRRERKPPRQKRNRPSGRNSALHSAYASISFEPRVASGRPASPHSFFSSSYLALFDSDAENLPNDNGDTERSRQNTRESRTSSPLEQVVHHHANGLCIVTAGEKLPGNIKSIEYATLNLVDCSSAEKRKRQAKMLRGSQIEGSISPSSIIGYLELGSGERIPLYACVWGMILELNTDLTPEVVLKDPLLDGYLAVILPSGDFPPQRPSSTDVVVKKNRALDTEDQ